MSFANFLKGSLIVGALGAIATAVGTYFLSLDKEELSLDEDEELSLDEDCLPDEKPIFNIMPGDMVQWESNGSLNFSQPRKVVRIEKSDMGTYVFVEGADCGIPLSQIVPMS